MKDYFKVTYRDIAKLLAKNLPLEGAEFGAKVEEYLAIVKRLTASQKLALRTAYVFSRKVPREEREDFYQELVIAVLEANTKDGRLAYAVARCDWMNWWRKYKTRQHFYGGSLDDTVSDSDGNGIQLSELLVGECEFENKMDGKLKAERIFNQLPDNVKPIVNRRLAGYPLNQNERQTLSRYNKREGYKLLLQPA